MSSSPEPADEVPSFLVERFDEHSSAELQTIASYVETREPSLEVPEYVVQAIALQDDTARTAIAEYADRLATHLETREATDEPADSDRDTSGGHDGPRIGRWTR